MRIIRQEPGTKKPQLARIGKIKCGMKVKNQEGKEYPTSVDYFIADGQYAHKFQEAYNDKPKIITIAFYTDDVDEACTEFYELRDNAGRLIAMGDGKDFKVFSKKTNKDGEYINISTDQVPQIMNDCLRYPNCEGRSWTENLLMRFVIPKIRGVYGHWEFRSRGAKTTAPNIIAMVDSIREATGGRLAFIPFDLAVKFETSQMPDQKRRFPVVTLIPNIDMEHLNLIADYGKGLADVRGLLTESRIDEIKEQVAVSKPEPEEVEVVEEDDVPNPKNPLGI